MLSIGSSLKTVGISYALTAALVLYLGGCSFIKPSFIDENWWQVQEDENREFREEPEDSILPDDMGPLGGHFDDEGNWIPDKKEIEWTYKIPDISAGFIVDFGVFVRDQYDVGELNISPTLQIELFELDSHLPYLGTLKFDFGVGYQRTYIYVGKLFTSIFEISAGGFCGWNFEDNELSYGLGFTIIRF